MPVILDRETCWSWLEEDSPKELQKQLKPYDAEKMVGHLVSLRVNSPKNDDPSVITPLTV